MTARLWISAAAGAFALIASFATTMAATPEAGVSGGKLAGAVDAGVTKFLGIPFAAPPIGDLRWKSPQPAAAWSGVRDAAKSATRCSAPDAGDGPRLVNEDCLYVDVYAPADAMPGAKLPVMVYFHGGGNYSGSPDIYDGHRMAAIAHAVVVMPAYRLGAFGFLAHSALSAEAPGSGSGDYGIEDQIAALAWVRDNAGAFGGDPSDVTLTGQSSGGADVCALMTAPKAKGLYARAIVQSGVCQIVKPMAAAEKDGADFAAALGCADAPSAAACLRKLPADAVLDKYGATLTGIPFGNAVLPKAPMAAPADGDFNKTPLAIGFTHDEFWSFEHGLYPMDEAKFHAAVKKQFADKADKVESLYPLTDFPHIEYALGAIQTDVLFVCPAFAIADSAAKAAPVTAYEFSDRTSPPWKSLGSPSHIPPGYSPGAGHTAELQYLYAYKGAIGPLSDAQSALADKLVKLWVGFGRDGAAPWPAYKSDERKVLELRLPDQGDIVPVTTAYRDHKCDYWNK